MKDPIKIIHKFKNNNRRIQYHIYIFVGSLVNEEILKILESIKNKDFYNTMINLSKKNYKLLEDYYGEYWYKFFFVNRHIKNQISNILKNNTKKKMIINKFGKDWFSKHFETIILSKIEFSFASNYYSYLLARKKIKTKTRKVGMDFRTYKEQGSLDENMATKYNVTGGGETDEIIDILDEEITKETDDETEKVISDEDLDDEVVEDFDLDELTKLYSMTDIESSKMITETSKLIGNAINDKNWEKKVEKTEQKYNDELDAIPYDTKLEDIFKKIYITNEYIFKDDTIKNMKNKIAISIPLNPKYNSSLKLLPEYQYFWSEYKIKNNIDRVMIGQKWIHRNELLKIDIRPNENLKVYENLRDALAYLKDSFGFKIKRDDDETNIISDYNDYITNNEIYMIDILNELGVNYKTEAEHKRNLYDVYVKIYFPLITYERFEFIYTLLNGDQEKEVSNNMNIYGIIKNDMKLEREIYLTVEKAKHELSKDGKLFSQYNKLFNPNYIIQSIIHVNINDPKNITGTVSDEKINLYRIFDNFVVDNSYPFIQYQTLGSQITYKFYNKTDQLVDRITMKKWFESAPYGLSFRVMIEDGKYISIGLHVNGRIEYKITWKEVNKATVDNINDSYKYVKNLLNKINSKNKKVKIIIPKDERFKYAFINTIQKFSLPEKFQINHNVLSDFSRLFFPYIALVIEPKKRISKKYITKGKTSKYGTYLRYKRITKYENRTRMHLRILYFLRNYELSDKELINEIAKQFNITDEVAAKELDYAREKYGKAVKKSKKMLKKLKTLPKSKPPGIGIDIQGRNRENYKIRITGARSKFQLSQIVLFMKVLIYLYSEIYLYKRPKYQKLKDTLKVLNKIAKRRHKVNDFIKYDSSVKAVKAITALDKKRLGFKPEQGQNQWTRSCQNSGNDKRRRPMVYQESQLSNLVKKGYQLNKETGFYEKTVTLETKGKKYQVKLRAVKLSGDESTFNYYTCDPSENKKHMYIGFLSRGENPSDLCMPCCFKKDQYISNNKKKQLYYKKCIGTKLADEKIEKIVSKNLGDKIYILQETNKIQEGRFIYLPKYLNRFFNVIWKNDYKIKSHYLTESKSGYFFKYTVKHQYYNYLAAIGNIYDVTIDHIKQQLIQTLENDKTNQIYTYLNNGDISISFGDVSNFINYLKTSTYLEYDIIGELLSIPGVISKNGFVPYILEKRVFVKRRALEKEVIKERYYLNCANIENNFMINDVDKDIIIIIKDKKYYFPIYRVRKDPKKDKQIKLEKKLSYHNEEHKNIIDELKKYFSRSCLNNVINEINKSGKLEAKPLIQILSQKNITIISQIVDNRNKCRYLQLKNSLFLPVKPSGIWYQNKFVHSDKIENKKLLNLKSSIKELEKIEKLLKLDYIPKYVYYNKKDNNKLTIISILLKNDMSIPIKKDIITTNAVKKLGISYQFQSLDETVDYAILHQSKQFGERNLRVKTHLYNSEGYNLYRLELSLYLDNDIDLKEKVINIVRNDNIKIKIKKEELRKILFGIIDTKLAKNIKLSGKGKKKSFATIVKNILNMSDYQISNLRDYCYVNTSKDKCNSHPHCIWSNNTCNFQFTESMAIEYVNRVMEEFIQDRIKFKEIIQEESYYVSDIVNHLEYTYRENQKIITTSNITISTVLLDLFGKDKIPKIGKKQFKFKKEEDIEEIEHELIELGRQLIQPIIPNQDSILRAYVNCYYWLNNPLYDTKSRNLGYNSVLQTQITYQFKAHLIDFIQNNKDNKELSKYLSRYYKTENFFNSAINKFRKTSINTDGKIELLVLSYIFPYPIVVYDNFGNVKYIFLNGSITVNDKSIKLFTKEDKLTSTIFLKYDFEGSNIIPVNIYSIYYL